ncbi:MAG: type II secretion system F family protein [Candidatus Nanopelagicaceae bacterium]
MFWLQVVAPISLAITGFALLYSDNRNRKALFKSAYANARVQLVEIVQRQSDKSEVLPRLEEIGQVKQEAYGEFRYRQLIVACGAALLPFLALVLMLVDLFQAISFSIFMGIGAYLIYDRHLSSLVKERRTVIESEFPAVVEMLTLAIAAGETPISAFARIADRSDAFLAKEFAKVVQQVRLGGPFHEALDEMGRNLKSASIRRFIDALVMALVRGAPIVEVLHRHVAEARINQRNLVMDKAGKAETSMMIPIVFLILPISVLFALWPSINQLSFFAS